MISAFRPPLALFLLTLLLTMTVWADSPEVKESEGKLEFSYGTLYVPQGLIWSRDKTDGGVVYLGRSPTQRLLVAAWDRQSEVDNTTAMQVLQKDLVVHLENAPNLKLLETLMAPYPWPGSVELRLNQGCAYFGSDAGKTLMIAVQGEKAEETANAVTASFKESISVRRQGQEESGAARIHSMLGTSTTFLLLAGFLLPAGLAVFVNRRKKEDYNPFIWGIWGLGSTLVISLLFSWMILSRFSWAGLPDYGMAVGDSLARFAFLFLVTFYFSRRWQQNRDISS